MVARFGFIEIPDLRRALLRTRGLADSIDFDKAMFVGTRDLVVQKHENAEPARAGVWRCSRFFIAIR